MIYEVAEKKGETLRVDLREVGEGQYEITIGDRTVHVDAVRSGPTIYSIIEDGRQFEAMVDEKGAHGFDILVAGRLYHFESFDERTKLLTSSPHPVTSGPQSVTAEMPGKVVKVNVSLGDAVGEGEGVVVVEAMKMENEIPSPIEGVVARIAVREGETVEAGAVLFVVEPVPSEGESGA